MFRIRRLNVHQPQEPLTIRDLIDYAAQQTEPPLRWHAWPVIDELWFKDIAYIAAAYLRHENCMQSGEHQIDFNQNRFAIGPFIKCLCARPDAKIV